MSCLEVAQLPEQEVVLPVGDCRCVEHVILMAMLVELVYEGGYALLCFFGHGALQLTEGLGPDSNQQSGEKAELQLVSLASER